MQVLVGTGSTGGSTWLCEDDRAQPTLLSWLPLGQELQAVGGDGQELGVVLVEQGHHLLQPRLPVHTCHLGTLLVEQQVVQRGDGIEQGQSSQELG